MIEKFLDTWYIWYYGALMFILGGICGYIEGKEDKEK